MKQLWRRLSSCALALTMIFALVSCGQKEQPSGGDAASVMLSAQQQLKEITSMRYTYAMEMSISAEGESMKMTVDGSAELTMDPAAAMMTMNMNMMGLSLNNVQIYMVSENGQTVAYTGMDMAGTGENQWYKSLTEDSGMNTEQYNAMDSFELYMKNGSNFKAAGKETVQGAPATRYEGVISPDMLEDTLEESGSLETSPPCWARITAMC